MYTKYEVDVYNLRNILREDRGYYLKILDDVRALHEEAAAEAWAIDETPDAPLDVWQKAWDKADTLYADIRRLEDVIEAIDEALDHASTLLEALETIDANAKNEAR